MKTIDKTPKRQAFAKCGMNAEPDSGRPPATPAAHALRAGGAGAALRVAATVVDAVIILILVFR